MSDRRAYAGLLLVLVAGLAAGVIFHEPILRLLGGHDHSHDAGVAVDGKHKKELWTCGMHPQVIQDKPGLCPICHMRLTPLDIGGDSASVGDESGERKVKYWWDPMLGPASISDKPGTSAMGMQLVPVYEGEGSEGRDGMVVTIDPVVVQNMGVRVAEAKTGPVHRTIRAVGSLEEAQPLVRDVNLRVSGWVEKLHAGTVGMHLESGDKLFELYSPEVQVAVQELIAARRTLAALGPNADALSRTTSETLLDATRRKLEQWGLERRQIDLLAKLERAPRTVVFTSPITGHLTEKMVVEGSAVTAGDKAMRIVDHSTLWLDSQVYAQDQPFMKLGQKVLAAVESVPGKQFEGEVVFIYPHVDPNTRTAMLRVALPNADLTLRPGMYATAEIRAELAEAALLVPREAVIDTGRRQVAFVVAGEGRFEPRNVKIGVTSDDGSVEILEGLAPGELVVTSGQFLLDAESRMREAIQKHLKERLLIGSGGRAASEPTTVATHGETHADHAVEADAATPAPAATAKEPCAADVDALFAAYLEMSSKLGAATQPDAPLDADGLVAAAQTLAAAATPSEQSIARNVVTASTALEGKSLDEQRSLFAPLSDAVVALAEACPPSKAVADELYVMFCPMKDTRWLQTTDRVANPYYTAEMKECGVAQRTIDTLGAR